LSNPRHIIVTPDVSKTSQCYLLLQLGIKTMLFRFMPRQLTGMTGVMLLASAYFVCNESTQQPHVFEIFVQGVKQFTCVLGEAEQDSCLELL
jgi:hypothetical protein